MAYSSYSQMMPRRPGGAKITDSPPSRKSPDPFDGDYADDPLSPEKYHEATNSRRTAFVTITTVEMFYWLLVYLLLIGLIIFGLLLYFDSRSIRKSLDTLRADGSGCPAPIGDGFAVGVRGSNFSTLIDMESTQQIRPQESGAGVDGRPIWVSKEGQVWVPDSQSNIVYVYDALSWNLIDTITLPLTCTGVNFGAYNPEAGDPPRGQIWLSCSGSDTLTVYDGPTRIHIVTVPLSTTLAPMYDFYDIRVGKDYAVVSITNTSSSPGDGHIIQYLTSGVSAFTVSKSRGSAPLAQIWYGGARQNYFYVVSPVAEDLDILDFDTLDPVITCTGLTGSTGVVTTPSENYVYITDSTSTDGVGSIFGLNTLDCSAIAGSPFDSPYAFPDGIMSSVSGLSLLTTHPASVENNVGSLYSIDVDTGSISLYKTLVVGSDGTSISQYETACPCAAPCSNRAP